jgi:hypothetical protein
VSRGTSSTRRARRRGAQTRTALGVVTGGMVTLQAVWAVALGFRDEGAPNIPAWPWSVAVLVAPLALAVYWRPAYRIPNCFFLTGASAAVLGFFGAVWGSTVAPVVAGATVLALLLAPRDGGWVARWGRDDDRTDDDRTDDGDRSGAWR